MNRDEFKFKTRNSPQSSPAGDVAACTPVQEISARPRLLSPEMSNIQSPPVLRRSFKFRAYPNKGTRRRLRACMKDGCKRVINNAIAERYRNFDAIMVAKRNGQEPPKWVTGFDQYAWIRKADHPELAKYPIKPLQVAVNTVDAGFKSFRALLKKGHADAEPPGQVRFVGWLTYHQKGWKIENDVLWLSKLGPNGGPARLRFVKHRDIEGKVKSVTIREKNGKWYVCFSCEVRIFTGACGPVSAPKSCVPLDLRQNHTPSGGEGPERAGEHNHNSRLLSRREGGEGPEKGGEVTLSFLFWDGLFLHDSDGRDIRCPEFYWTEIDTLRRLARALSRKELGSKNRRKARRSIANWHEHIASKRDYWLWGLARFYAMHYAKIIVPVWPLKQQIHYAVTSRAAMKLCDGAYGKFLGMLKQKCEEFGSKVEPRKDQEQWEIEMRRLTEVARLEALSPLLRKTKRTWKSQNPEHLQSLARDCERVATLRI